MAPPQSMRRLSATRQWDDVCERVAQTAAIGRFFPGADRDDVLQEARIGVAKALADWQPQLGPFVNFALLCARRQVLTGLKTAQRAKHQALNEASHLDAPIASDDGEIGNLHDLLWRDGDDPAVIVLAREEINQILARFSRLSAWEREVVERVVLLGEPYGAVGPLKRVDNAMQRARNKLADDTPEPEPDGRRIVYIDRTIYPTERQAIAAAMGVCVGTVLGASKRKLIDGRERDGRGRRRTDGRLGQPVWRIDLEAA